MKKYTIKNEGIPKNLFGPFVTENNSFPAFWLNVWISLNKSSNAPNTIKKKIGYINSLYEFNNQYPNNQNLDIAISNLDIKYIESLLTAFFVKISNKYPPLQSDQEKWSECIKYIEYVLGQISDSSESDLSNEFNKRIRRLKNSFRTLHFNKKIINYSKVRVVPKEIVSKVFEKLNPGAYDPIFKRPKTQWNAYIFFQLAFTCGLRRSEILILKADSVMTYTESSGKKRYWIEVTTTQDDQLDPRSSQPSIKTVNSIRNVPISESLYDLITYYLINIRGKVSSPYLLISQRKAPLSYEGVTKYFDKINEFLSSNIDKKFINNPISPHDLRHTCAAIRFGQFVENTKDTESAVMKLRLMFGWSKDSSMPSHYAKAQIQDMLDKSWDNTMDNHIQMLSKIPRRV